MNRRKKMDKEKRIAVLKKIFFLKPLPTVVIAVPSFVLVFFVLANGSVPMQIAYISYILSAYALIITITGFPKIINALKNGFWNLHLIRAFGNTRIGRKFFDSALFRSEISLQQGLVMNILYVAVKLVSGIMYRSVWLIAFGIYYLLLAVMRGSLVHYVRSAAAKGKQGEPDIEGEFHCYRMCGIVLLLLNQALACIVIYIVHMNQGMNYPGLLIYAMAVYAFYAVITAVINVIRFRSQGSPVHFAAKVISLTAALVSMLSLETAMISQFGGDDLEFRKIMTSISGGVVCTFVLAMAIYMIIRSTGYLKNQTLK
jgi:hypothetical protein